jgi:hypothetical protein
MKSLCCGAEMKVVHGGEGTHWHKCLACGEPCDPQTFVIQFEDRRFVGGYNDVHFPSELAAREGMANIRRKRSRVQATLIVNGKESDFYDGKKKQRRYETPLCGRLRRNSG